ncbi:hypothetical protein CEUSTIGMA_g73.t1 [Chlamydomonas eustigma]|uniref:Uncharacterized protein n=1 Tax=Chlamydomonas eustigma TaxID=1157962 RepID=A0A250WP55_9CHLO|nr:hypothetical protein CEUSTIGMA_g73.t1 [Chlamydomonas eustigma]|eukprot:GAX72617.1 hypothetical protein CEUSTIGMA_g73.t1 [Chlamydomonas eustigma]
MTVASNLLLRKSLRCISVRPFVAARNGSRGITLPSQQMYSSKLLLSNTSLLPSHVPRSVPEPSDPAKALMETAALDELIDRMLSASNEQQMAQAVAENIVAIDTKFWMRLATRNDTAASKEDKEKLQYIANSVMVLVDAIVRKSEQQLSDSGKVLQEVLSAAADEKGEWYLPLAPAQVLGMRRALDDNAAYLDEALLSNAFAWIRKCSEDGFDTMAQLIQKVLQLYAARQLKGLETEGISGVVNSVVYAEEKEWASIIKGGVDAGEVSEPAFMEELQRRMERVVLGLQSGSYAQRVQAEYLKEVEARAKAVFKDLAT